MTDRAEDTPRPIDDIDLTSATPHFAVDLERPAPPADGTAERLARVERLLEADLAALGPSVVTASIADLTARLDALAARLDEVGARWEGAEEQLAGSLAARVEQRLDRLDARLDRLTRLVEAATEPEPEGMVSPTDAAIGRVSARLDELVDQFDALSRRLG